jgi:hypothetical protein
MSVTILQQWLEFLAAPGNFVRLILDLNIEPWASVGVSAVFVIYIWELWYLEGMLRVDTDSKYVLVPDWLFVTFPDSGFNTWVILFVGAVCQGPLSAMI